MILVGLGVGSADSIVAGVILLVTSGLFALMRAPGRIYRGLEDARKIDRADWDDDRKRLEQERDDARRELEVVRGAASPAERLRAVYREGRDLLKSERNQLGVGGLPANGHLFVAWRGRMRAEVDEIAPEHGVAARQYMARLGGYREPTLTDVPEGTMDPEILESELESLAGIIKQLE